MRLAAGLLRAADGTVRCAWCGTSADYVRYHDEEWGVPVADDVRLFEKLSLEGFQAGLSWLTILRKRERFRRAFRGFVPGAIASFGTRDIHRLLADTGIVRHRGKIEAVIHNATLYPALCASEGSLAAFLWRHEPQAAKRPRRVTAGSISPSVPDSRAASGALRARGWKFVGPTTMYALFQAAGMVNDHIEGCVRRPGIEAMRRAFTRPL